MKICILSDSHDHIPLMVEAAEQAKAQGAEVILHCGDIVAPSTLHKLSPLGLPVHAIHGNNMGDLYALSRLSNNEKNNIHYYGQDAAIRIDGKRFFIVHYPHYARAMAITGNYDVVCCGHTHNTLIESHENIKGFVTVLLNPGTVGGVGNKPITYILGDLTTMEFTVHELTQ